jgi:mono/diheme cytochrome c family protein
MRPGRWTSVAVVGMAVLTLGARHMAAQPTGGNASKRAADPHAAHGTPHGWKFTWPAGDPGRGRAAFIKFECYACHEVRTDTFPAPKDADKVGPELSAMGPLHDADYFAEAILNPGAVIEKGKHYEAPDGSSKMPSYNDSMTVQELVDLVAYLRGLKPAAGTRGGHSGH